LATYYLVRHGTTTWVDQQILHGVTDIPLNEEGLQQAREVANALRKTHAKKLYSSPLQRAMQTAEIISETTGLQPVPLEGLTEIDFGWMEGKQIRDDIQQDYHPLIQKIDHCWMRIVRAFSGESQKHFMRRIAQTWHLIQQQSQGQDTIIIGHSGVLSQILMECFGGAYLNQKPYYALKPCSITEFHIDPSGSANLIRLDDSSHLKEIGSHGN